MKVLKKWFICLYVVNCQKELMLDLTWSLLLRTWASSVHPAGSLWTPCHCCSTLMGCCVQSSALPHQRELKCHPIYELWGGKKSKLRVFILFTRYDGNHKKSYGWYKPTSSQSPRKKQQQRCRKQSWHWHHGCWTEDWASCSSRSLFYSGHQCLHTRSELELILVWKNW